MKIFEAYDAPSIRILFKNYIEAEGISVSRREQTYKRFGTYMSRIRGVLFDRMLLDARDEAEFRENLDFIFLDKWKNHLGYPEIPAYFYRYLDFLHTLCAVNDEISIDGLTADSPAQSAEGRLTQHEERFVTADGKLRILANPSLIRALKAHNLWSMPASDEAARFCSNFYDGCQLFMTTDDWKQLIDNELKPKRKSKKRGELSFEIKHGDEASKIYNSNQAMELIISLAGIDKVAGCNLKLNGQPIIVRKIPAGRTAAFKDIGNGFFLNNMGSAIDRYKVMRVLISLFRLPLELNLSKEAPVRTPRKLHKTQQQPQPPTTKSPESDHATPHSGHITPQPDDAAPQPDNFNYGHNGTLNLFDDP